MGSFHRLIPVLALACLCLAAQPTSAEPAKDCASLVPDRAIKGCTALIDAEAGEGRKKAYYLTQRARAYIDARQYPAAEKDIAAALAAYPDYPAAYGIRGRLYGAQAQHAKALEDYNTYLRLSDNKFAPLISRGNYFLRVKKIGEAVADFEAAKALKATAAAPYLGLARARRMENNAEAALSAVETGLSLEPANVALLVERAEMRLERNDAAGAKADFEKALEVEPELQRAMKGRERAVAAASAAPAAPPPGPVPQSKPAVTAEDPRFANAAALQRQSKWAEALAIYDEILKVDPKTLLALSWRGFCLEQLGRTKQAVEAYAAVIGKEERWGEASERAVLGIARLALTEDDAYKTAADLATSLIQIFGEKEEPLRIRIRANFKRTRFEAVAADAARLALLSGREVEGRAWEALALAGAGKLTQALKIAEDVTKADAENALAAAARAWAALQKGDVQAAETESRKAVASAPSSSEVMFVHQLVLLHKTLKASDEQFKAKNRG